MHVPGRVGVCSEWSEAIAASSWGVRRSSVLVLLGMASRVSDDPYRPPSASTGAAEEPDLDPATDAHSSSRTRSRSPRANAIIVVEDSHQEFVATPGCPACAVNQDLRDRIHELEKQNQILRRRLRASEGGC